VTATLPVGAAGLVSRLAAERVLLEATAQAYARQHARTGQPRFARLADDARRRAAAYDTQIRMQRGG
jgi:hypothetical protein